MGRNWDWSFDCGREKRLQAEHAAGQGGAPVPGKPPLHSHDSTMQSFFEKGWASPTPVEIQRYINPPPPIGLQLKANHRLRDLLGI
jgi:hypothetical protein